MQDTTEIKQSEEKHTCINLTYRIVQNVVFYRIKKFINGITYKCRIFSGLKFSTT